MNKTWIHFIVLSILLLSCSRGKDRFIFGPNSETETGSPFAKGNGNGTGIQGALKITEVIPKVINFYENTDVIIKGENFVAGLTVVIAGESCSSVSWISSNEIQCRLFAIPASQPTPAGGVVLTNPNGEKAYFDLGIWTQISLAGSPTARRFHTTIWTGSKIIIFGGSPWFGRDAMNDGGSYDPISDSWGSISTVNAPEPRESHTAVWSGTKMLVYGGYDNKGLLFKNTGGLFDPASNSWSQMEQTQAPPVRMSITSVWTGSEMIVIGGTGITFTTIISGGVYHPDTNSWSTMNTNQSPINRTFFTAIWTGSEMIVFGGIGNTDLQNDGARYNPSTDAWTPISTVSAPAPRYHHTSVWNGQKMLVFGGSESHVAMENPTNTGGQYNPFNDTWSPITTESAPSPRTLHTAVWTGKKMLIGLGIQVFFLNTGGLYDPEKDSWNETSSLNAPEPRSLSTSAWTSAGLFLFGGTTTNFAINTGAIYLPLGL